MITEEGHSSQKSTDWCVLSAARGTRQDADPSPLGETGAASYDDTRLHKAIFLSVVCPDIP